MKKRANSANKLMKKETFDSEGKMWIYVWSFAEEPNVCKMGDHFVKNGEDGKLGCENRIRESQGVNKHKYDDGKIIIHVTFDASEYAKKHNRNYKNAKLDTFIGEQIGHRIKGTDHYRMSGEEMVMKLHEITRGKRFRHNYSPRLRQQQAIDKFTLYFSSGGSEALLGAIMRFGKNFTSLNIVKNIAKVGDSIIVLTNKPDVFESLEKDISSHELFTDFHYTCFKNVEDKPNYSPLKNKVNVIAVSKQLADNSKSGRGVKKLLKKNKFKMCIIDECHSGTNTPKFNELLKLINTDHTLYISGTPQKTFVTREFNSDNTFFYDYTDQEEDKRNGIVSDAVSLKMYIPAIDPAITNNPLFIADEMFTLTKLFGFKNGEFLSRGEVMKFLEDILGVSGKKAKYSPYLIQAIRNSVWLLPSDSKMIVALAKMIREIRPDITVFAATGNEDKSIKEINEAIERGEKTITLTCSRFIEGTTVPGWDSAFVLCDTESAEKYFQFIFRPTTPAPEKHVAYIFDFSINRSFTMMYENAVACAERDSKTDISNVVKTWLDNLPIYRSGDGPQFIISSVSDIISEINKGDFRAQRLKALSDKYIDDDKITDYVINLFKTVKTKSSKPVEVNLYDNGVVKGKNYIINGKERSANNNREENILEKTREKISNIISAMPWIAYITNSGTIEDIVDTCDEDILIDELGVDREFLSMLLTSKCIKPLVINAYL